MRSLFAVLVVALAISGCSGDSDSAKPPTSTSSTTEVDAPAECIKAWRSGVVAPTRCEEYKGAYSAMRAAGEVVDPPGTPTTTGAWPPAATVRPGARVFGVYLDVSYTEAFPTPESGKAEADARAVGYETSGGDIACDQGAMEQLGLDPAHRYRSVAIYFTTRMAADQFVEMFDPGVVGIAEVTLLCAD